MYADVKGLITVGIGNLIDPRSAAVGLPFVHKATGAPASSEAIGAEWDALKANCAELGRKGHRACEAITHLRLTEAAIDELVLAKVRANETVLRSSFPDFDSYPADAQLGLHSMAWALGPAFASGWPNFSAAVRAVDFEAAAANCRMNETGNAGLAPRNDANQIMFRNAAAVVADRSDPDVLHYPSAIVASAPSAPDPVDPPTDPEVDVEPDTDTTEDIDGVTETETETDTDTETNTDTDADADADADAETIGVGGGR